MSIVFSSKASTSSTTELDFLLSPTGMLLYVASGVEKVFEYSPQELIGRYFQDLLHPEDQPMARIPEVYHRSPVLLRFLQKSGEYFWAETVWNLMNNERGEILSVSVTLTLLNPFQQADLPAESLLQLKSEKLYRSLFANHPDLVLLTSAQGVILNTNQNNIGNSLSRDGDLVGKNFMDFLSEADRKKVSSKLPDLLNGHNVEFEVNFEEGPAPNALVSFVPFEEDHRINGFFIQIRDLSERIQHEQEILLLNEVSQALSSAGSLKDGMDEVIRLLCQFTNFQYGEFWMPMFGVNYLVMKSQWYQEAALTSFAAISRQRKFEFPNHLPPLIAQMETAFCGNLEESKQLNRKELAKEHGLKAYLPIPLIYRGTYLGGIVLFSNRQICSPSIHPDKVQNILNKLGAEIERRKANEELDNFFTLTPDLFGIVGFDGLFKKINPAFEKVLGFSEQEFFSRSYMEFIHPDDQAVTGEAVARATQGLATEDFAIRCRRKAGGYLWISWTNQPVVEEGLIYIVGRDITEQKKQLKEFERIKFAVEHTSDAIVIGVDEDKCLYTNKAFEQIFGTNAQDLNSRGGLKNIFARPSILEEIGENLLKKGHWEGNIEAYDTHGHEKHFHLRCNTVFGEKDTFKYFVGIFTDISAQRKAQDEIVKLSKAVEESGNEVYILDLQSHRFSYVNQRAKENLGYTLQELRNMTPFELVPSFTEETFAQFTHPLLIGRKKNLLVKTEYVRKDQSVYPVEVHLSLFQHGNSPSIIAQAFDITERKRAEEALRISNERYQLATKATQDAILDWDLTSNTIYVGDAFNSLFGHNLPSTLTADQWIKYIHPEDAKEVIEALFERIASEKTQWSMEYRYQCADGTFKFIRDRAYIIHSDKGRAIRMTGAMTDITEHKKKEELLQEFNAELEDKVFEKTHRLQDAISRMQEEMEARAEAEKISQQSLKEKEILLKEIHHRVKNNMAIISSLLSLQARQTNQDEVKALFKDSQSRIKSMALIHEHLYQNKNLSNINFKDYVKELMEGISRSFQNGTKDIRFEIEAEEVELDIVNAVPCGLILNELITNCYKYAFKNTASGCIKVIITRHEAGRLRLLVADNGIGLPEEFTIHTPKTLGLKLVGNLVKQLKGVLEVKNKGGACFTVVFPI